MLNSKAGYSHRVTEYSLLWWLLLPADQSSWRSLYQASSSGTIPFLIQPDADAHPETSVARVPVFSFSLIILLPPKKKNLTSYISWYDSSVITLNSFKRGKDLDRSPTYNFTCSGLMSWLWRSLEAKMIHIEETGSLVWRVADSRTGAQSVRHDLRNVYCCREGRKHSRLMKMWQNIAMFPGAKSKLIWTSK